MLLYLSLDYANCLYLYQVFETVQYRFILHNLLKIKLGEDQPRFHSYISKTCRIGKLESRLQWQLVLRSSALYASSGLNYITKTTALKFWKDWGRIGEV